MLRGRRAWSTPAPILAEAAALDFGVVTYMIVRRLHPPPPGPRAPPQVTRRMAAAVLGASAPPREPVGPDRPAPISTFLFDLALIPGTAFLWGSARQRRAPAGTRSSGPTGRSGKSGTFLRCRPA